MAALPALSVQRRASKIYAQLPRAIQADSVKSLALFGIRSAVLPGCTSEEYSGISIKEDAYARLIIDIQSRSTMAYTFGDEVNRFSSPFPCNMAIEIVALKRSAHAGYAHPISSGCNSKMKRWSFSTITG